MGAIGARSRLNSFIEERTRYRTIRPQVVIALIAGFAFAFDMGAIYIHLSGTEARSIYGPVLYMFMITYVLVPYILWFGIAVGIFAIGRSLGARLQFGILFRAIGWGMIPVVGMSLFLSAGRFLALQGKDPCEVPAISCSIVDYNPLVEQVDALYALASVAAGEPIFQMFYAIAILCFLIAAVFWVVITEGASTLTTAGALIAVGVPVLVVVVGLTLATF